MPLKYLDDVYEDEQCKCNDQHELCVCEPIYYQPFCHNQCPTANIHHLCKQPKECSFWNNGELATRTLLKEAWDNKTANEDLSLKRVKFIPIPRSELEQRVSRDIETKIEQKTVTPTMQQISIVPTRSQRIAVVQTHSPTPLNDVVRELKPVRYQDTKPTKEPISDDDVFERRLTKWWEKVKHREQGETRETFVVPPTQGTVRHYKDDAKKSKWNCLKFCKFLKTFFCDYKPAMHTTGAKRLCECGKHEICGPQMTCMGYEGVLQPCGEYCVCGKSKECMDPYLELICPCEQCYCANVQHTPSRQVYNQQMVDTSKSFVMSSQPHHELEERQCYSACSNDNLYFTPQNQGTKVQGRDWNRSIVMSNQPANKAGYQQHYTAYSNDDHISKKKVYETSTQARASSKPIARRNQPTNTVENHHSYYAHSNNKDYITPKIVYDTRPQERESSKSFIMSSQSINKIDDLHCCDDENDDYVISKNGRDAKVQAMVLGKHFPTSDQAMNKKRNQQRYSGYSNEDGYTPPNKVAYDSRTHERDLRKPFIMNSQSVNVEDQQHCCDDEVYDDFVTTKNVRNARVQAIGSVKPFVASDQPNNKKRNQQRYSAYSNEDGYTPPNKVVYDSRTQPSIISSQPNKKVENQQRYCDEDNDDYVTPKKGRDAMVQAIVSGTPVVRSNQPMNKKRNQYSYSVYSNEDDYTPPKTTYDSRTQERDPRKPFITSINDVEDQQRYCDDSNDNGHLTPKNAGDTRPQNRDLGKSFIPNQGMNMVEDQEVYCDESNDDIDVTPKIAHNITMQGTHRTTRLMSSQVAKKEEDPYFEDLIGSLDEEIDRNKLFVMDSQLVNKAEEAQQHYSDDSTDDHYFTSRNVHDTRYEQENISDVSHSNVPEQRNCCCICDEEVCPCSCCMLEPWDIPMQTARPHLSECYTQTDKIQRKCCRCCRCCREKYCNCMNKLNDLSRIDENQRMEPNKINKYSDLDQEIPSRQPKPTQGETTNSI